MLAAEVARDTLLDAVPVTAEDLDAATGRDDDEPAGSGPFTEDENEELEPINTKAGMDGTQ